MAAKLLVTKFQVQDYVALFILSGIWGASFLFMRIASPVFGPIFLIELRVLSALIFLLPVFLYLGKFNEAAKNWKLIFIISLTNMSLPFCLLAFATLSLSAGFASVLTATVPFFTALFAYVLWSHGLSLLSICGMLLGFIGVAVLVFDPSNATPGSANIVAVIAGLLAALLYGFAATLTAQKLSGISGLAVTVGGLFFSALCLLPFAILQRPDVMPSGVIWLSVCALGVVCTGMAYLLFYRLIRRVGPNRAVISTFLIPIFSILWGKLFLAEAITSIMLFGFILILGGVGITTGKITKLFRNSSTTRSEGAV